MTTMKFHIRPKCCRRHLRMYYMQKITRPFKFFLQETTIPVGLYWLLAIHLVYSLIGYILLFLQEVRNLN